MQRSVIKRRDDLWVGIGYELIGKELYYEPNNVITNYKIRI